MSEPSPLRSRSFVVSALGALVLVCAAYANHFDNGFQFDDGHTIENNLAIRSLANVPRFFVDASTTSSLPTHRAYRPGVTTLHAIDVALGGTGEPQARVFHRSIFVSFLLLCALCFIFFRRVFDAARPSPHNAWWALCAATLFGVHTANAETINYVSARSDSASTLMVLAALVVRLTLPKARARFADWAFLVVGFFIKEPAVMLVPLVGLVTWFFEEDQPLAAPAGGLRSEAVKKTLKAMAPGAVVAVAVVGLSRALTPSTWDGGGAPAINYIATQPFVVLHYVFNFLAPVNLVIDTDWRAVPSLTDDRVFAGALFVAGVVALAWLTARRREWRPIAFGVLWFLLTLLPTSLVRLAEVLNDHRPFFGYVGLCLAVTWAWALAMESFISAEAPLLRRAFAIGVPLLVLLAHGWGVRQRNAVWGDDVALWGEAASKAPEQGRNHMNYATTLMKRGRWAEADAALQRAQALLPLYGHVYINQGIVYGVLDKHDAAERAFLRALELSPAVPDVYSHFGEWLLGRGRVTEAMARVRTGLEVSAQHARLQVLERQLQPLVAQAQQNRAKQTEVDQAPTLAKYLDLSLAYYQNREYPGAIQAALAALKLEANSALAYNNICASFNQLRDWANATDACNRALAIEPRLELARNNLAVAARRGANP